MMTEKVIRAKTNALFDKFSVPYERMTDADINYFNKNFNKRIPSHKQFKERFPNIPISLIRVGAYSFFYFDYETFAEQGFMNLDELEGAIKAAHEYVDIPYLSEEDELAPDFDEDEWIDKHSFFNVAMPFSPSHWDYCIPKEYLAAFCCLYAAHIGDKKGISNVYEDFALRIHQKDKGANDYLDDEMVVALSAIMSKKQKKKLEESLKDYPDVVTIYRGEQAMSAKWKKAYCWTLDKNVAEWFAAHHKDMGKSGRIITCTIPKDKIICCENDSEKTTIILPKDATFVGQETIPVCYGEDRYFNLFDFLISRGYTFDEDIMEDLESLHKRIDVHGNQVEKDKSKRKK